jgi:hypothetical protein
MDNANIPADYVARLRSLAVAATERFVHIYEPVVLRFIGRRLSGSGRERDRADVAQEVFTKFFAKLSRDFERAISEQENCSRPDYR